jgi:hypothetical protein
VLKSIEASGERILNSANQITRLRRSGNRAAPDEARGIVRMRARSSYPITMIFLS